MSNAANSDATPKDPTTRERLAAILAADAVAYSRLMAVDERATVTALESSRRVFSRLIADHQGRLVDMAGDSVLAVFGAATGALAAALRIQESLSAAEAGVPEERRMRFRIGVHIGDVTEKSDGTVYGDGVNVAARLQALASPGGVTVSESVRSAVRGRVEATFIDIGEQAVKHIPHPVRAYAVQVKGLERFSVVTAAQPLPFSPPSIAVLPFKVLADDERIRLLADGLAEDVIALLARIAGFVVISRASSFVFSGRDIDVAAIAGKLGVRYIVEGSIRPVQDQMLRVSTELTEASSGRVLWSRRFESRQEKTVDLQEDIARGVISELEPELTRAEIALIRRQRPENVDAWGCYRQAVSVLADIGWSEESINQAGAHLRRAFTIDPEFALPRAQLALVTALGIETAVLHRSKAVEQEVEALAGLAISLDDNGPVTLGLAGCALADIGLHQLGLDAIQRSLEIDPSNAQAYVARGAVHEMMGKGAAAIDEMRYGMRISPRDKRLGFWRWILGRVLLRARRPEEALQEARVSAARDPKLYLSRVLEAGALQDLGRTAEAADALARARYLRPKMTFDEIRRSHEGRIAELIEPLWQGRDARSTE